jgi:hypothetical protein
VDFFTGAGEASADVPGGGETENAIEETGDKLGNTNINGAENELDGENRVRHVICVCVNSLNIRNRMLWRNC